MVSMARSTCLWSSFELTRLTCSTEYIAFIFLFSIIIHLFGIQLIQVFLYLLFLFCEEWGFIVADVKEFEN